MFNAVNNKLLINKTLLSTVNNSCSLPFRSRCQRSIDQYLTTYERVGHSLFHHPNKRLGSQPLHQALSTGQFLRIETLSKRSAPSPRIRYGATVKQQPLFAPLCKPRRLRYPCSHIRMRTTDISPEFPPPPSWCHPVYPDGCGGEDPVSQSRGPI